MTNPVGKIGGSSAGVAGGDNACGDAPDIGLMEFAVNTNNPAHDIFLLLLDCCDVYRLSRYMYNANKSE